MDKREYLTAIIVPSAEAVSEQLPSKSGLLKSGDEFIHDAELTTWIAEEAKKMSQNLAKFERIKNFLVKREPFSVENGDMTITLKVKRKVVMDRYAAEIDAMYASTDCPL